MENLASKCMSALCAVEWLRTARRTDGYEEHRCPLCGSLRVNDGGDGGHDPGCPIGEAIDGCNSAMDGSADRNGRDLELLRAENARLREGLQKHIHTQECWEYAVKTALACGSYYCTAKCADSRRQLLATPTTQSS